MIKNVRSILSEDEKVYHDARVHWVVFVPPAFYTLIGLLLGYFISPIMFAVVMLINLYPLYMATVSYQDTHLILTNRKVIGRQGFLSRDWNQLAIDKIESSYIDEPILGRMLGYSTVMITGVGTGLIAFPHIADGEIFIKKLQKVIGRYEQKSHSN